MGNKLEFFFDYVSPYTYLANTQLDTLGVTPEYRPIVIVDVMKRVNNQPSPLCPPKGAYIGADAARWAGIYNVPFVTNQGFWGAVFTGKFNTATLVRGAITAAQLGVWDRYHNAMFDAIWAEQADVHTPEGRAAFAERQGLPGDFWSAADGSNIHDALEANNTEAAERGVFGSPTFFLNQEIFFGNDRLDFIRRRLGLPERGLG
ncbi:MAG TPA: 2-hydroxychromene-2-carboxylate isomerase [Caulobacter sp.]|nr:2-hydroxychromene-2-carboxylate isomerase [Caulobacter sp.]